ncbi:MAG: hypothetical protein WCG98_05350 [bacterium]
MPDKNVPYQLRPYVLSAVGREEFCLEIIENYITGNQIYREKILFPSSLQINHTQYTIRKNDGQMNMILISMVEILISVDHSSISLRNY